MTTVITIMYTEVQFVIHYTLLLQLTNDVDLLFTTLADLAYSETAQLNSFMFSNIAPQHWRHNRSEMIVVPKVYCLGH